MRTLLITATLLAALTTANAEIYKCQVDGKTLFTDQPCNGDPNQQSYLQSTSNPKTATAPQATQPVTTKNTTSTSNITELETKYFILDDEISRAKSAVEKIKQEQTFELERLKSKKSLAMNNNAGANWEQSISTEMAAVVELYNKRIDRAIADIERDEKNLNEIKNKIKELKTVSY